MPSLQAEVDAWITAVNGNASNTGRQITREKGYQDATVGTTGNQKGFVFSAGANSNTEKGYLSWLIGSASDVVTITASADWTDDTSNNGYGSFVTSGGGYNDSSSHMRSGVDIDYIIAYDTTDGQEFYCQGVNYDNNGSHDGGFTIWKAENGEWVFEGNDGTTYNVLHYWTDGSGPTG